MHSTKDRVKNIILIGLIMLSIVQVEIYWNYQSDNQLGKLLGKIYSEDKYNFGVEEFFRPDRIIVSEGFDENHWILKKNSWEYEVLWKDAKSYIKDFLDTEEYKEVIPFDYDNWSNVIIRKSILIEFDGDIDVNLVSTLLGNSLAKDMQLKHVKKVLMQPFEDVNNVMTFYVADESDIYKVTSPISNERLPKEAYDKLIASFEGRGNLNKYSLINEIFPNKEMAPFNISSDVLIAIDESSTERYNSYFCMLPILLDDIMFNNNSDLDDLSREVLGENIEYYDIGVDAYGTVVFKNVENIFRLYKDGVLEYKYLDTVQKDKDESIIKSFKIATEFIANLKGLTEGADITLISAKKNSREGYKFTFDYKIDDMPVIISNYKSQVVPGMNLKNAIEIVSTGNRVISCFWILRDFDKVQDAAQYYVAFEGLLDELFKKYNIDKKKLEIQDMYNAYIVNFNDEDMVLEPQLIATTSVGPGQNDFYSVSLRRKD
ncbi:MAG: hypothetical protein J6Y29_04985 [Clostridiales bacterium]|nr:hypothetical protein [Clostridiales bacterium]